MKNITNVPVELNSDLVWKLLLMFCLISVIVASSDIALATSTSSSNDVIGNTLCRLVSNLTGGIAKGIATIAIFAVGIGLFLGKVNWGLAAITAAAVGIIFSAGQLVDFLGGGVGATDCPTS